MSHRHEGAEGSAPTDGLGAGDGDARQGAAKLAVGVEQPCLALQSDGVGDQAPARRQRLPAGLEHTKENLAKIVSLISQFGKVRMLGSAALMLCYVASGRCDSYWERRIRLWDIAAGLAIVVSAGGQFKLSEISEDFKVDVEAACAASLLVSRIDDR